MSFEIKAEINGWNVRGADDEAMLQEQPERFEAVKGNRKVTLARSVAAEGLLIRYGPEQKQQEAEASGRFASWWLKVDGKAVAWGRDLQHVLRKAVRFMERN